MEKNKRKGIFVLILLVAASSGLTIQPTFGAITTINLSTPFGFVDSTIRVTGNVTTSGQAYRIYFDLNGNGNPIESGELITSGNANGFTINTTIPILPCIGSDVGRLHLVALYDPTSGAYVGANFSVRTSRWLSVSTTPVHPNGTFGFSFSLSGAGPSEAHTFSAQVRKPDGTLSGVSSFNVNTTATGSAYQYVTYPGTFNGGSTSTVGTYTIYANETWPGNTILAAQVFQVAANVPPTATIDSISPNPAVVGTPVHFAGHGNDTDGWISAYRWTVNGSYVNSSSLDSTFPIGNHSIFFQVQDNDGAWSLAQTQTLQVRRRPSTPVAYIDNLTLTPPGVGPQVTFSGHGTDPPGTITAYLWTTYINGGLVTLGTSPTFSTSTLAPGTYTISFQVKNDLDTWSTAATSTLLIPRINTLPNAVIDSITPAAPKRGEQVTFVGHGVDLEGSIVGYLWESNINGVISNSQTFSRSDLALGTHIISLQVQDNDLNWSQPYTQILTIIPPNVPPNAAIDSVAPNPAREGTQVSFSGHGTDTDGSITVYSWSADPGGFLSTLSSFSTSSLAVGVHRISLRVQDNNLAWSNLAYVDLTIVDNAPPVATLDSVPSKAFLGKPITLSGHGDDQDGSVVAYRWISSIDGPFGNAATVTVSNLSLGTHTIYFEVQDDNQEWSTQASQTLTIEKEGSPLIFGLVGAGAAAVGAGVGCTYYALRPQTSAKVNESLEKKIQKENKKQEKKRQKKKNDKDKTKPLIELETQVPATIADSESDEAKLTIANKGFAKAENVVVLASAGSGIELANNWKPYPSIEAGKQESLSLRFKVGEKVRKGVYSLRVQVTCPDIPNQVNTYYLRAVKIGLISTDQTNASADLLRAYMKQKGFKWDELQDANNLSTTLLKYDLLILSPELQLPEKGVRNLSSFVENSQSLLAIDKMDATGEKPLMAKLLGYSEAKFEPFKSTVGQLKISDNNHELTRGLALGEQIPLQAFWGNPCTAKLSTGKILAEYSYVDESGGAASIPAVVANEYGRGAVVHLNFHAEQSAKELEKVLDNSFNWLLAKCTSAKTTNAP